MSIIVSVLCALEISWRLFIFTGGYSLGMELVFNITTAMMVE